MNKEDVTRVDEAMHAEYSRSAFSDLEFVSKLVDPLNVINIPILCCYPVVLKVVAMLLDKLSRS